MVDFWMPFLWWCFIKKKKKKGKQLQQQKTRALCLDSVLVYPEHLLYIKDLHAKKNHFKSKTVQNILY